MSKNYFHTKITISDAIDYAKIFNEDENDKFARFPYLYASQTKPPLKLESNCYLAESPKIINDEEVYPEFVNTNSLNVLCTGDVFIDVYDALESEKENFTKNDFIRALNYYLENDEFIEL